MTEQLALVDVPVAPKLTDRQQAVLDALHAASHNGLEPSEAGAVAHELKDGRWRHSRDDRCAFCGSDGLAILRRLRELGLARYRAGKLKVWQAVGTAAVPAGTSRYPGEAPPDTPDDERGVYGSFPAGF